MDDNLIGILVLTSLLVLFAGCSEDAVDIQEMNSNEIESRMLNEYKSIDDYQGRIVVKNRSSGATLAESEFKVKKFGSILSKFLPAEVLPNRGFQGKMVFISPMERRGDIVIFDGDTFWLYDASNDEVQASSGTSANTPIMNFGEITRYTFEEYNLVYKREGEALRKDCYVLEFVPKVEGGEIERGKWWIDQDTWLPLKIVTFRNGAGNRVTLYRDLKINEGIPNSEFDVR